MCWFIPHCSHLKAESMQLRCLSAARWFRGRMTSVERSEEHWGAGGNATSRNLYCSSLLIPNVWRCWRPGGFLVSTHTHILTASCCYSKLSYSSVESFLNTDGIFRWNILGWALPGTMPYTVMSLFVYTVSNLTIQVWWVTGVMYYVCVC